MKKSNKKIVLSTAAVLGVAALAAGGTIAYFTDKDTKTNTFTIGDVNITLYESQLHRMNSGRTGIFHALASDPNYCDWDASHQPDAGSDSPNLIVGSYDQAKYCTPEMDANEGTVQTISALKNGHVKHNSRTWGFLDSTIITDSTTKYDAYLQTVGANLVPGQWVRKFTYVKNESTSSDAYILIRYMVPEEFADNIVINMPSSGYTEDADKDTDGLQPYFLAVEKNSTSGEYEAVTFDSNNPLKQYKGKTQTINNKQYRVYAAVTNNVVNPGEMTFWSPVNTVKIADDATNTDPTSDKYVEPQAVLNIEVDAQAIQAKTFSSALDAIKNLE